MMKSQNKKRKPASDPKKMKRSAPIKKISKIKDKNIQVSHTRKPDKLQPEEWQSILRKQIAEKTELEIKNLDNTLAYGDYSVTNPASRNHYKVAIRSKDNSRNFCTCLDFKTNGLGTCKHIEAVLSMITKKPQGRKALDQPYEPAYSSLYLDYRGLQNIRLRVGTENSRKYNILFTPFIDDKNILSEKGHEQIEVLLKKAKVIDPAFRCYDDAFTLILKKREEKRRIALIQPFLKQKKLPSGLNLKTKLFPYQTEGVLFCAMAGRSILADDMGLGKTIQGIAYAELMKKYFGIEKIIIVCPTSLKYQWQSEIRKFSGSDAIVAEGNPMKREVIYNSNDCPYIITSYHAASNDWSTINAARPDLIILDEAQRIKNWRTKVSQSMKRLQSKYALVLTGTPLENNLEELYSLTQFINPLLLGSLYNFLSAHQLKNEEDKVIGYKDLDKIGERLKTIMLRRTKKEVLKQLPDRRDQNIFLAITDKQMQLHNEYADLVALLVSKWKRFGFLKEEDRNRLMIHLNQMRMVCDSTYIIDQETNHQTKLDELSNILDQVLSMPEEKVVIFSQWERMTRLVAERLTANGIFYQNLHGGIPGIKRKALIEEFQNNENCRIFLSTDAGGTGLNLQKAAYLINLDIPWNPAVLEQRIARIYRLGQKKNVTIINLVAQDTIEERMLEVLRFKSSLFEGVLDNGESTIFLGESKFKKFMQSVEAITSNGATRHVSSVEENEEISVPTSETANKEPASIRELENENSVDEILASVSERSEPADIVKSGMQFMEQLGDLLRNPERTKEFVASIVEKNPENGKTYLKIPVQNEEIVQGFFEVLNGFFGKK